MNTKRKNLRDDEDAVSPVIGVILMVAITVVMAAVIGAFVYGYGGSMAQSKDVSCVAQHHGDDVIVTYMGGPDQTLVDSLSADINGTVKAVTATVGSSVTDSATVTDGVSNHIVVTATFTDGTKTVILDTFC